MTAITIDTYALITSLKDAGMPEQQAKAQIDAMAKFVDTARKQIEHDHKLDDVATKRDLKELELTLKHDIREIELTLVAKMAELKSDTVKDVTKWVATMIIGQTAAVLGILKLLGKI